MGGTEYRILHRRVGNDLTRRYGPNARPRMGAPADFERKPLLDVPPKMAGGKEVKESGVRLRESQITAAITSDAVKACSEIAEVVSEHDRNREIHEGKIRDLLDQLSASQINNLRYKLFAPHYDEHMDSHASAIRLLLSHIPQIERIAFPERDKLLVNSDLLELSCGTGTIIEVLSKIIPRKRLSQTRITANDLSEDMKRIAREKLAGLPCPIEFTSQDISKLRLGQSFGTIILSQTLHLITNPDVVRQERQDNYMHVDSDRHIDAKFNAIQRAWDHLGLGGTMIVIDEWPALLTDRGGPLGSGFAYLFNDSLREIEYEDFRHSIMGEMPGSRFVSQLKVPIDAHHAMHLIIYQRGRTRSKDKRVLPDTNENLGLRNQIARRVVAAFQSIDRRFIQSFRMPNGTPWVSFMHMKPDSMLISRTGSIPDAREEFSGIVLDRVFHELNRKERHIMLRKAISALKIGGSLMVVDEWPSNPISSNPIRKSQLRSKYLKRYSKNLVYGGALRIPIHADYDSGMFGYQYWKVL